MGNTAQKGKMILANLRVLQTSKQHKWSKPPHQLELKDAQTPVI
jgi:hypothetical protein